MCEGGVGGGQCICHRGGASLCCSEGQVMGHCPHYRLPPLPFPFPVYLHPPPALPPPYRYNVTRSHMDELTSAIISLGYQVGCGHVCRCLVCVCVCRCVCARPYSVPGGGGPGGRTKGVIGLMGHIVWTRARTYIHSEHAHAHAHDLFTPWYPHL